MLSGHLFMYHCVLHGARFQISSPPVVLLEGQTQSLPGTYVLNNKKPWARPWISHCMLFLFLLVFVLFCFSLCKTFLNKLKYQLIVRGYERERERESRSPEGIMSRRMFCILHGFQYYSSVCLSVSLSLSLSLSCVPWVSSAQH